MAEFTPTRGFVQNHYAIGRLAASPADAGASAPSERDAEFDRWLAAHDAETEEDDGLRPDDARRIADMLDGHLMRVADGTWTYAQFVDAMADFVTLLRARAANADRLDPKDEPEPMPVLPIPDGPKMLRETLCAAQAAVGWRDVSGRRAEHMDRLSRLIEALDAMRPLGPDGKHGDRHTPSCGCEDAPAPPSDEDREVLAMVDDAIKRVPKLGGAGAIYEAELLTVLRAARDALAARSPQPAPTDDEREAAATAAAEREYPLRWASTSDEAWGKAPLDDERRDAYVAGFLSAARTPQPAPSVTGTDLNAPHDRYDDGESGGES